MAVVTLSRGTFSGGNALATCLAANLGYQVLSREVLVTAAAEYGVREEDLVRGMEHAPTLIDRFRIDRQLYLAAVTAALCRAARADDVIYHGNAGHMLLAGADHILRVRVIAPLAKRVEKAISAHGFDRVEAEEYIQRKDAERVAWARFLYGVEWRDPLLYDLVVNLEKLQIEAACQAIAGLIERPRFVSTPERRQTLDDIYLANHLKALLFSNPTVAAPATGISITSRNGVVELAGLVPDEKLRDAILATVSEVPEVHSVRAEMMGARGVPV